MPLVNTQLFSSSSPSFNPFILSTLRLIYFEVSCIDYIIVWLNYAKFIYAQSRVFNLCKNYDLVDFQGKRNSQSHLEQLHISLKVRPSFSLPKRTGKPIHLCQEIKSKLTLKILIKVMWRHNTRGWINFWWFYLLSPISIDTQGLYHLWSIPLIKMCIRELEMWPKFKQDYFKYHKTLRNRQIWQIK